METESPASSDSVSTGKILWATMLGVILGYIIAVIGISITNAAFQEGQEAIGVGFVALCAGIAYDWPQLGRKRFTSIGAGYLFSLGLTLSFKLQWPGLFWPLMNGIMLFMIGNMARKYIATRKKSPSS